MLDHEYAQATFKGLPKTTTNNTSNETNSAEELSVNNKHVVAKVNKVNKLKNLKAKRSTKINSPNNGNNTNDVNNSRTKLPMLLRQKIRDGNAAFSRLVNSMTHHNGSSLSSSTLVNGNSNSTTTHGNKSNTLPVNRHLHRKVGSENVLVVKNDSDQNKEDPLYDVIYNYVDAAADSDAFLEPALFRCHPSLRRPRKKTEGTHVTTKQQSPLKRRLSFPNLLVQTDNSHTNGNDSKPETDTESIQTSCLSTASHYYDLNGKHQAQKIISSQNADNFVYDSEEEEDEFDEEDEEEFDENGDGSKHLVLYFLVK